MSIVRKVNNNSFCISLKDIFQAYLEDLQDAFLYIILNLQFLNKRY